MVRRQELTKKEKIIALRVRGLSYSEIKSQFPVSKSTLSAWLKDVKMSGVRQRELLRRSIRGLLKGAEQKKMRRISETNVIHSSAMQDIKIISKKELWLMGIMLYWACGLEEKDHRTGLGVRFSSSDSSLIKLFLEWLTRVGNIKKREIGFDLYLHESRKGMRDEVIAHWAKATGFPRAHFSHVYFQKNKIKRKNTLQKINYGLIRIRIRKSSLLARQISGWILGIKKHYWGSA